MFWVLAAYAATLAHAGVHVIDESQVCDCGHHREHEAIESPLYSASMVIFCVSFALLASGLSVSFSNMDPYELTVLKEAHEDDCQSEEETQNLRNEKRIANLLLPTLKEGNRLLVTFVIVCAVANEALPLFLDQLLPEWVACLLSVTLVIFIGEILPATIFRRGSRQMQMAASMIPVVHALMFILAPVARPVAYLLDFFVDPESESNVKYTRAQMNAMLNMHVVSGETPASPSESSQAAGSGLAQKEVHAIRTIISSRVVWKTFGKAPILHADHVFRGFDGTGPQSYLLVKDDTRVIGSISAAALAAEHARHGDLPVRNFELKPVVCIDTTTKDPALFEVLCGMSNANANFTICGSPERPEGFVTMKSIVAQLVCGNASTPMSRSITARRKSSMSLSDASQLRRLQEFVSRESASKSLAAASARDLKGSGSSSSCSSLGSDNDNEGEKDAKGADDPAMSATLKRRLYARRGMLSTLSQE